MRGSDMLVGLCWVMSFETDETNSPGHSPTQLGVSSRGFRVVLLWVGMVVFFVTLWNWVGPGSLK
jgi:hypothetical protein